MKKVMFLLVFFVVAFTVRLSAQCSICTKTASQLGEGPAKGMNSGIIYLMLTPLAIGGVIAFRWWKREKEINASGN